jgi:hypothetical protein
MRARRSASPQLSLDDVFALLESALDGPLRRGIVADAAEAPDLGRALTRIRDGMRAHVWKAARTTLDLERAVQKYDRKTRLLGFHVLHDWDGIADRVNDDIIPVDVAHYLIERRGAEPVNTTTLALLLDYYFLHLLALLSLRIWDAGDPDGNLDRIDALLHRLQGSGGSGQPFVADAETLILIATSHYELHERGYGVLLEKTRTLDRRHQLRIAMTHAVSMGCHLRFGFEASYGRDTITMRDDNVADYPWLCYAVATIMQEYVRMRAAGEHGLSRSRVEEALLNGFSADARALIGRPPSSLRESEAERAALVEAFHAVKTDLLPALEAFRPTSAAYSPLAFFFNFAHNVLKGLLVDAVLEGRPWPIGFNGLLTSLPDESGQADSRQALADTLMAYARANPHRIRGRLRPVIVYDATSGREVFSVTVKKLAAG